MCLDIDANGDGRGKNTHGSWHLILLAGEYDDRLRRLEWPFEGKIDIELLNWKENKRHRNKTVSIVEYIRPYKQHRIIIHSFDFVVKLTLLLFREKNHIEKALVIILLHYSLQNKNLVT